MRIKLILATLVLLAFSLSSYAGNISLEGGTIKPGETFIIGTQKLAENGYYNVTCKLTDVNKVQPVVNATLDGYSSDFWNWESAILLNGTNIGEKVAQFVLKQTESTIQFCYLSKRVSMKITNLEETGSISVSNCVATPILSNK